MPWRLLAAAAALAGYALLSYWLMVHATAHPWTVAALFGPLVAGMAATGLARRHGPTLAGAALLAAALALVTARGGVADVSRLYVLQHAAIHAMLAWSFGITLRRGGTPLITMMAERIHDRFTPEMRRYTRWLTQAWAVYFVAMIVVSFAIYGLASWETWSVFCNLVTPVAAGAFFVGEHLVRRLRHPEFERVSLAAAVRAYRNLGQPVEVPR